MKSPLLDSEVVHDILGIGFGPSNLALSIAVEEHNRSLPADRRLNALFLERQPRFGWHRGMLIDDATMQVSFLKDLVTLRNPTSDYSFLCFLREQGRLIDFLNQKTLFPLRVEFHEYFEWAAARVSHLVSYGSEVVSVDPVRGDDGEIAYFDVTSRGPSGSGTTITRRAQHQHQRRDGARTACAAGARTGRTDLAQQRVDPRATRLADEGGPVRRAVVLGAGQSAAEAVDYLHRTFPAAEVCSVFAKYGYTPADDSPFANRIFDPEAVDVYFSAPSEVKQSLIDYHRSTNYSVVDMELIEALYATAYREKVAGRERLRFLNVSRIRAVDPAADGGLDVAVEFLPTGEKQVLSADVLVLATGYRPRDLGSLLGEAAKLCLRDDGDEIRVGRDHRVETVPEVSAGLYLQGGTEHTHGLTSTLLSTVAVRAEEIHRSVRSAKVTV